MDRIRERRIEKKGWNLNWKQKEKEEKWWGEKETERTERI